jgi:hypothetical protein
LFKINNWAAKVGLFSEIAKGNRLLGYGLWDMSYGLWVMRYELWVMGYGL